MIKFKIVISIVAGAPGSRKSTMSFVVFRNTRATRVPVAHKDAWHILTALIIIIVEKHATIATVCMQIERLNRHIIIIVIIIVARRWRKSPLAPRTWTRLPRQYRPPSGTRKNMFTLTCRRWRFANNNNINYNARRCVLTCMRSRSKQIWQSNVKRNYNTIRAREV